MIPLLAAIFGAMLGGGVQVGIKFLDRRFQRAAILCAFAAEVGTLCEFIVSQRYAQRYAELAERATSGLQVDMIPIDATQKYFVIYESISGSIGILSGREAATIVRLYTIAKIALDTARSDSVFSHGSAQNLQFMRDITNELLILGESVKALSRRLLADEMAQ